MEPITNERLHEALLAALAMADNNQSRFASGIGKFVPAGVSGPSQQLVSYWVKNGRPLPAEFAIPAEKAGFGSRYDLRPDIYPREDVAEQRTHDGTSVIDDEMSDRVLICAVCDEPFPDPCVRACGNHDCPHTVKIAAAA